MANAGSQTLTKLLYIGTITLNVALLAVMELVVRRQPEATGGQALPDLGPAVGNVVLLVVALVLTLLIPGPSYWTLLLLTVDEPVLRLWRRARHRPSSR